MTQAPLYAIAQGPDAGAGFSLRAADDVQLRLGLWQHKAAKGTVLLIPGRTEYIEKYGPAAADLRARGFDTLVLDLRGQEGQTIDMAIEVLVVGHSLAQQFLMHLVAAVLQ